MHPASIVAQQEIFGPVLAAMTFRTPKEAVELANNTVYGLAASVWSESINLALQTAAQIKAGVVWVNSTNLFDAACGFGGYRESGYGREGGKRRYAEYLEPTWFRKAPALRDGGSAKRGEEVEVANPSVDRTVKLYVGGKQARPDSGYSVEVRANNGKLLGESPLGNRKDIRNAVEAARKAESWARTTAHNRAQMLVLHCGKFVAALGGDCRAPGGSGRKEAGRVGSEIKRGAGVFLCGMDRQVRWRGAQSTVAKYFDRDE